jgi:Cu/Ag efflux protein CusF
MIASVSRLLLMGLVPVALTACVNPGPASAERDAAVPLGIDLGPSGPVAASAQAPAPTHAALSERHASSPQDAAEMQMARSGHYDAHGTGTVNSVDPAQHKLNLSHSPIPEIGWPGMTMDFPAAPSVDLKAIKPGTRVNFTIQQQPGSIYEIQAITPAGGGR